MPYILFLGHVSNTVEIVCKLNCKISRSCLFTDPTRSERPASDGKLEAESIKE